MTFNDDEPPIHSAQALHERNKARKKAEEQELLRKKAENKELAKFFADALEAKLEVSTPKLTEYSTVTSVRETALSFDATLQEDMDHFIAQLQEQSDAYLRVISSDPQSTCPGLGIQMGKVPPVAAAKLAEGELLDRHRDSDKGHEWWKLWVGLAIGLVSGLILFGLGLYFRSGM